MAACNHSRWEPSHDYRPLETRSERQAWRVAALTGATMLVEIAAGYAFNSMALLADGWHMASHMLAIGLTALAYLLARRYADDPRFAFGTWKIEVLAGYTSAVLLLLVAASMAWQSFARLVQPSAIHYDEAIPIAIAGLLVNLVCAWLLRDSHDHHHGHEHGHAHGHGHGHGDHRHDINLRAAYLHVVADAATSVLAILALLGGKYWAWAWLDPVMGLVGAALVSVWAVGLLRESGRALLDAEMDAPVVEEIREVVRDSPIPAEISDLHVWRVGRDKFACILGVTTAAPALPEDFRRQLAVHEELVHITVEINPAG